MNKKILSSFAVLALTATLGMAQHDGQYGQRDNNGQRDNHDNNRMEDRYDRQAMAAQESWGWRYDNLNLSWSQRRQMSNMIGQFRRDDERLRNSIMRTREEYRGAIDRGQMERAEQLRIAILREQSQYVQRRAWELDRLEGMLNPYQRGQFESINGGREGYRGFEHHGEEHH